MLDKRTVIGLSIALPLSIASAITLSAAAWAPEFGVQLYVPFALLSATCLATYCLGIAIYNGHSYIKRTASNYTISIQLIMLLLCGLGSISGTAAALTLGLCIWVPEFGIDYITPLILMGVTCLALCSIGIAMFQSDGYEEPVEQIPVIARQYQSQPVMSTAQSTSSNSTALKIPYFVAGKEEHKDISQDLTNIGFGEGVSLGNRSTNWQSIKQILDGMNWVQVDNPGANTILVKLDRVNARLAVSNEEAAKPTPSNTIEIFLLTGGQREISRDFAFHGTVSFAMGQSSCSKFTASSDKKAQFIQRLRELGEQRQLAAV